MHSTILRLFTMLSGMSRLHKSTMTSVKAAAWGVPIQTLHAPNSDLLMENFLLHEAEQLWS
jgi:hypothetical protein